jgi:phosphoribosylformylglycinamidine synthase
MITKLVRDFGTHEVCFSIESNSQLESGELAMLRWVIAESFEQSMTYARPAYERGSAVEIGPRHSIETPHSSNAISMCKAWGLDKVTRIEESRIYKLNGMTAEQLIVRQMDKMTQEVYPLGGFTSFNSGMLPEETQLILMLEEGEEALRKANKKIGLGMDEWDTGYYTKMFADLRRNPTDVEIVQVGNANSDHSRHWFFKGIQEIDGVKMPYTLLEMVMAPLQAIRERGGDDVTVLAFNDNVGALRGCVVPVFRPINPGRSSCFEIVNRLLHITASAETHNHPTMWSPYHGAATKIGGWLRDMFAGGRGSYVKHALAGYSLDNLFIPGYQIPGEVYGGEPSKTYAIALQILCEGIKGDYDYGNQFGVPTTGGYIRSFRQLVSGEQRGNRKPIFWGGGAGLIDDAHIKKHAPEREMLIVAIGGPAYPIGIGGGAASSMIQGQQDATLDFNSVQRGNGEMGNKTARVIRVCVEMGDKNPIESVHDQGAGGPSNVLTELMEAVGGKIDIRKINLGDKTMSVLAIWSAEYQERYGLLIRPENLELFQEICERERVNCEVLGEITGDGHVTVIDSIKKTTPVRLNLEKIIGKLPQKTFKSNRIPKKLLPPQLPSNLTLKHAIEITLQQLSAGSKGVLVHMVDRSVGGCVAQQQCCGRNQLPIGNVQVSAHDFFGLTGLATSVGENPLYLLIDAKAGARMAFGEMLTNMISAGGIDIPNIRCRVNCMAPAKLPGEGALLYDEYEALKDFMIELGFAADGGKDSSSLAATVDNEIIKSPGALVIEGVALMSDITKVLTPDVKDAGKTQLGLIDLGLGKNRMGGAALLQALNQLGDESPDADAKLLAGTWKAIQRLRSRGAILSLHDRSDGGLATAIIEMCLAGSCGLSLHSHSNFPFLFNQELGIVIEYYADDANLINTILRQEGAPPLTIIGATTGGRHANVFGINLPTLRQMYERTSHEISKLLTKNGVAVEEFENYKNVSRPVYHIPFIPKATTVTDKDFRPRCAVLREEGHNGDREMAAAFWAGGLNPKDVHMSDLLRGKETLDDFQGLIFPGGFSFMDVFGSAKGQAGVIKFNPQVSDMFDRYIARKNTFIFGDCNGFQLLTRLGIVPFRGLAEEFQPQLVKNRSEQFESRWIQIMVAHNTSIFTVGMEGLIFGVNVDHAEGNLVFPDANTLHEVLAQDLAPFFYVDEKGHPTERYPFNPNGSIKGIAALCSPCGRFFGAMPHIERAFLRWQCHHWPKEYNHIQISPWLRFFQNARQWCLEHR